MTRVLNIHDWAKLHNVGIPQFFFIDDSLERVERINDGCMFFVGDFVEYTNEHCEHIISYIKKFDPLSLTIVYMLNGDATHINDLDWEAEFYNENLKAEK